MRTIRVERENRHRCPKCMEVIETFSVFRIRDKHTRRVQLLSSFQWFRLFLCRQTCDDNKLFQGISPLDWSASCAIENVVCRVSYFVSLSILYLVDQYGYSQSHAEVFFLFLQLLMGTSKEERKKASSSGEKYRKKGLGWMD